eukprot:CAMPEP_0167779188 /NCGR_PEP_ID=MMETSP0111_2-20121227/4673_1 /TAXON_ID=91324 /ORGANISM="Lotharella globosa, Strain CCCM811" /LENGTH=112 /DNA_ID=CAMNT_0007669581 /DNA_START=124 /DNA_END=462 /DNA_ORIENTATION=-
MVPLRGRGRGVAVSSSGPCSRSGGEKSVHPDVATVHAGSLDVGFILGMVMAAPIPVGCQENGPSHGRGVDTPRQSVAVEVFPIRPSGSGRQKPLVPALGLAHHLGYSQGPRS